MIVVMSRQPQAAALPSGASTVLRNLNERSVVVQLLHDTPLTRVDLAERTGLALPTISRAVANLERSGIVRATGRDTSRKGPAAALYEVRPVGGGLAAAVSVTSVGLAVSLLGLRGERVALAEAPAERVPGGAPLHLQVRGLLERALAHAGASRPEVWHGVVSVPTVVDAGGVLHRDLPSALPAFDQVSIDAIVELFGGAATVENDVNLSALGERAAGVARDVDDFVYVSVGRGLGMGVVMHGEIHRGPPERPGRSPACRSDTAPSTIPASATPDGCTTRSPNRPSPSTPRRRGCRRPAPTRCSAPPRAATSGPSGPSARSRGTSPAPSR